MSVRTRLKEFTGDWSGTNRLWLSPDEPARESATSASAALAAGGACLIITYTWADLGQPQDGILLVRIASEPGFLDMVWFDSWHTGGEFMTFHGEEDRDGHLSARGSYSAPPGPDWGWRILLADNPDGSLQIQMVNISPEGDEALAVDARYTRAA